MLVCGYKIQGVFKEYSSTKTLSFQGVFIASLLCLALSFDMFHWSIATLTPPPTPRIQNAF